MLEGLESDYFERDEVANMVSDKMWNACHGDGKQAIEKATSLEAADEELLEDDQAVGEDRKMKAATQQVVRDALRKVPCFINLDDDVKFDYVAAGVASSSRRGRPRRSKLQPDTNRPKLDRTKPLERPETRAEVSRAKGPLSTPFLDTIP